MREVVLQAIRVGMLGREGDIPRVGLVEGVLAAPHADQARDLAREGTKSIEQFVGVIPVVQGEEDDVGQHRG